MGGDMSVLSLQDGIWKGYEAVRGGKYSVAVLEERAVVLHFLELLFIRS